MTSFTKTLLLGTLLAGLAAAPALADTVKITAHIHAVPAQFDGPSELATRPISSGPHWLSQPRNGVGTTGAAGRRSSVYGMRSPVTSRRWLLIM